MFGNVHSNIKMLDQETEIKQIPGLNVKDLSKKQDQQCMSE